ncbi:MAG: permease [Patescibacteria group bacterium]|nr:permease [Patescibacteria group bacterium]
MVSTWQYFLGFLVVMSALGVVVTFLGACIRTKFSTRTVNRWLLQYDGWRGRLIAAVVGMVTPFCSCTTVPIFAGLIETRINFGTAITFLIASPSISLAAMVFLVVLFGYKIALEYVLACLAIAFLGGTLMARMKFDDQIRRTFISLAQPCQVRDWRAALRLSFQYLKYFSVILLLSAAVGAAMYNYIPDTLVRTLTANNSVWIIPFAVIVGAVIYADMIVLLPIGYALLAKGVNQGIVFSFLIATAGISLPSILMLSKILRPKPLAYFVFMLLSLYTLLGVLLFYIPQ